MSEPADPKWGVGDLIQFMNRNDEFVYGVVIQVFSEQGEQTKYKIHWLDDDNPSMETLDSIHLHMNKVS